MRCVAQEVLRCVSFVSVFIVHGPITLYSKWMEARGKYEGVLLLTVLRDIFIMPHDCVFRYIEFEGLWDESRVMAESDAICVALQCHVMDLC